MSLCCVIINESKTATLRDQVSPAWLAVCAAAVATQLNRDIAPHWGLPDGAPAGVRAGSGPADIQPGEMVFAIVDDLPDAPGAIAYHDVEGADVPVAFLALNTCSSLDDVSTAISHELVETAGDAACNLWADDGQGHEFARELCDACESAWYLIDGIRVSDFLLPAFFAPNAPGPYSHEQTPVAPFTTIPGGYQITRLSSSEVSQVTGQPAPHRRERLRHWSARPARRRVRWGA